VGRGGSGLAEAEGSGEGMPWRDVLWKESEWEYSRVLGMALPLAGLG
jgi:hypothetical protein